MALADALAGRTFSCKQKKHFTNFNTTALWPYHFLCSQKGLLSQNLWLTVLCARRQWEAYNFRSPKWPTFLVLTFRIFAAWHLMTLRPQWLGNAMAALTSWRRRWLRVRDIPHISQIYMWHWLTTRWHKRIILSLDVFLQRCMKCRRGLAMRILSVCLSARLCVRPSNTWIVTKQNKIQSRFLYRAIDNLV